MKGRLQNVIGRLRPLMDYLMGAAVVLVTNLRERGYKPLQRPLIISGCLVVGVYWFFYRTSQNKLLETEARYREVKTLAEYATTYQDARRTFLALSSRFPSQTEKETWLLNAIRETLREEGLTAQSLSRQGSENVQGSEFVSLSLTCSMDYLQLGSWLARIQNYPKVLFVSKLTVLKDDKDLGKNQISATIGTFFPSQEMR